MCSSDLGGVMPGAAAAPTPMGQAAVANMAPAARMARAAMVRKALTGMKKGGHCDEKHIAKLEKELHHHEALSMEKAHGHKHGGKMHHKASGGEIDKDETRTTIKGNEKKFEKSMVVDGKRYDKAHGTGDIKEGKPAGDRKSTRLNSSHT